MDRSKAALSVWGTIWRIALTLNFVVLARILFRAQDFGHVGEILSALGNEGLHLGHLDWRILTLLGACFVVHWFPRRYVDRIGAWLSSWHIVAQGAAFAAAVLIIMQAASTDVVPFIYFQF